MIVREYDIENGVYLFRFQGLEAEMHSHPAIEIISSLKGNFTLSTPQEDFDNLTLAVVDANTDHRLSAKDCDLVVLLIEHRALEVHRILRNQKIVLKQGLFTNENDLSYSHLSEVVFSNIKKSKKETGYDPRVQMIIDHLNSHDLEYSSLTESTKKLTNLSYSRVSHLFKEHVGISLKKYFVWNKLKRTIEEHLSAEKDLFSSLIKAGFYDQPHFTRSFKEMMGIKPTAAYNSNTVQVSEHPDF